MCIGSRSLAGDGYQSTLLRRLGIRFFSWFIGLPERHCGHRSDERFACVGPKVCGVLPIIIRKIIRNRNRCSGVRHRLKIGEIAVHMHPRQGGVTSLQRWRPVYYMVKVTLAILLDRLRRKEHL